MPLPFNDRSRAAFLGLALGDAYGRPLEFTKGSKARTRQVVIEEGEFRWTDDTHMAIYLGEALLELRPGPLSEDALGCAVGEKFSAWLDDPLTPTTAPGSTCMAGARSWRQTRDWRSSGVTHSDGCGAVMRICPLPLACAGDDLTRAARVSALITHGHANAAEAAVAGSHLLRWTLERGQFSPALVQRAIVALRGPWAEPEGGMVASALEAALAFAEHGDSEWLDEKSIPPGDGGWRASSALGLAVAAALRWGDDFCLAVEKAARIDGDSDSVACLTGMFLGAAGGTKVLPEPWLSVLPWRDRITKLADDLAVRGEPWVAVADLHGHPKHLEALLAHLDAEHGDAYRVVTVGDYVDNGPDIPGLLSSLVELREERGERYVPILGNHDLACLKTLGWPKGDPDPKWFDNWRHYWDPGRSTPTAYAAQSAAEFAAAIPASHRAFLESLPWFLETGRGFFVHAGLEPGPIAPQRERLQRREMPGEDPQYAGNPKARFWLLPQLRDKAKVAVAFDSSWEKIVVSGHTKSPANRAKGPQPNAPHFVGPNRICLSGDLDRGGPLAALLLPEWKILEVDGAGSVKSAPVIWSQADE